MFLGMGGDSSVWVCALRGLLCPAPCEDELCKSGTPSVALAPPDAGLSEHFGTLACVQPNQGEGPCFSSRGGTVRVVAPTPCM